MHGQGWEKGGEKGGGSITRIGQGMSDTRRIL